MSREREKAPPPSLSFSLSTHTAEGACDDDDEGCQSNKSHDFRLADTPQGLPLPSLKTGEIEIEKAPLSLSLSLSLSQEISLCSEMSLMTQRFLSVRSTICSGQVWHPHFGDIEMTLDEEIR